MLHHIQGKRCCLGICVGLSSHVFHTLIQSCVSERDRRISAVKQFIDCLSFFQPRQSAVLPKDRGGIGQSSFQAVVSAHKSTVAEIQPLVKNLPELLHIPSGRQGNIHKVNGHNTLVETSVKLIVSVLILPRA